MVKKKKQSLSDEIELERDYSHMIQHFIKGKPSRASSQKELISSLEVPSIHITLFKQTLISLIKEGILKKNRQTYHLSSIPRTIKGILRTHIRGFGFVQVSNPQMAIKEVFIPKHLKGGAVDGDEVEVVINPEKDDDKIHDGKVTAILNRGRTHLAGTVSAIGNDLSAKVYAPILGEKDFILVFQENSDLVIGDRIIIEVETWGTHSTPITGKLSQKIGHISDPSFDIPAAIEEFGLHDAFPQETLTEAHTFGTRIPPQEIQNRDDLRWMETITIDPNTAKDFDDALSLIKDKRGHYHLTVHIADVSHYVKKDSFLDQEAQKRGNSTYFPNFCLPMLPKELSESLCSLKPNVNRLAVSVLMVFSPNGNLKKYRITRSVIKSQKRFTYAQVMNLLDGKRSSKHLPTLKLMVELCLVLKQRRKDRGGIDLALPELALQIDEEGHPTGTEKIEYDITHQLVEEFMIQTNETIAKHLSEEGTPLAYRIHEQPQETHMREFAVLVRSFEFPLPNKPSPAEIQQMLDATSHTPYGPYLATSYIRRMKMAIYSPENIGHYGLGLEHYCHFTSPIRRYSDLVVHRALFGDLQSKQHLEEACTHCSGRERISARAEGQVRRLKKLRFLKQKQLKKKYTSYTAIVTRILPQGIVFEIEEIMLEGFIHIANLGDDYYVYEPENMCLRGEHSNLGFSCGDRIEVTPHGEVDLITLSVDWYLNKSLSQSPSKKRKKKKKKEKKRCRKKN